MKNTMRRAVAFMLMACLLLSVMAPVTFKAEAATTEGNVTSYDIVDGDGLITEGKTNAKLNATNNNLGDFTYLAKADDIANAFVYTDETNGYLFGCAGFKLSAAAWLAVKFSVETAGDYKLNVLKTVGDANIAVVKYSDWTGDVSALSVLGDIDETYELTLEKTDYVLVMQANYEGNQFRIAGMTLEKKPVVEPIEASYNFIQNSYAGDWNLLVGREGTAGVFQNHTAAGEVIAVKLNDTFGKGTYQLDLIVRHNSSYGVQEVYMIPASILEEDYTDSNIKNNMSDDYNIGTVNCNTTNRADLHCNISIDKADSYVLALKSIENDYRVYRAGIQTLTMTPTKVVNGTYYTVAEAITAGVTNLQLTGDLTENVTLGKGETLDLAGNTLTGNVIVSDGNIIDTATDSADATTLGGIVGTVQVQKTNTYLPLKDGNTWRFFQYELATYEAYVNGDAVEFWFDMDITNAAGYTLLSTDSSAAGLEITAMLSWNGAAEGSVEVGFKNEERDIVAGWAAAEQTEEEGKEAGMYLSVTGIPADTTVSVVPVLESTAGVKCNFGAAATYPAA